MIFYRFFAFVLLLFFFTGCLSPLKQIKNPNKPFESETAELLPPAGNGWRYVEQEEGDGYVLHFSRQGISQTHTVSALFFEFKKNTNFSNPKHFLNYIRQMKEADIDPWRHKVIESKWILDSRFGDYSVHYYSVVKDYDPYRMNAKEYSLSKLYGYAIVHPYFKNVIIDILYTEQGKPAEVSPQFEHDAFKYIQGLHLKQKE